MAQSFDFSNPPEGVFCYRTETHFDQLDALNVLHHSRYLPVVERAQQALFDHIMETEAFDTNRYTDLYAVVRKFEIEYLRPIDGVFPFRVTVKVDRLREAGLTTAFAFWSDDGAVQFARGRRVICHLGAETHRPSGWSPRFRERYARWEESARSVSW